MHLKVANFWLKSLFIHPQLFEHYKALKSLHATSPSPSLAQRSLLYTYSAFNLCTGRILSVQYLAQRHNDEPPSCRAKTVPKCQANVKTLKAELLSCTQVKIPDVMSALQDPLSDQPGSLDTHCRSTDTSPSSSSSCLDGCGLTYSYPQIRLYPSDPKLTGARLQGGAETPPPPSLCVAPKHLPRR